MCQVFWLHSAEKIDSAECMELVLQKSWLDKQLQTYKWLQLSH